MQTQKKLGLSLCLGVICLYIVSAFWMSVYYSWKDIKTHDSFIRAVLVSPIVGVFKASHWPYYAFMSERKGHAQAIDTETEASIESFFVGYEYFSEAHKLGKGITTSRSRDGDLVKVKTLLAKAELRLSECNRETLNREYSGWGSIVHEKAIPAIDLYLASVQGEGDRNDSIRADALMVDLDTWLSQNWDRILFHLNKKYGYEIKKES